MEELVEKLLVRRSRIRELIEGFGKSDRKPFPKWGLLARENSSDTWISERWGSTIADRIM
jgi:hypothetical protein